MLKTKDVDNLCRFVWYVQTENAGHAREVARTLRLDEWDGIVIVSGDGLIFEVCGVLL